VLIHAAAGGVGQAALQVARRQGARIFATASQAKQAALLEQGVEAVFDSRSTAFAEQLLAATGGRGVDVVLNSLKGEWVDAGFRALAVGGRFVELGKLEIWSREQARERRPDARYLPFDLLEVAAAEPQRIRDLLAALLADLQQVAALVQERMHADQLGADAAADWLRRLRLDRERSVPGDPGLPPDASSRAIDEYLAVLDDAAFGAATPVTPKFISPADPASRWTGANKGLAFFAYATNYLIDLDHAIIVDVEPSTAVRQAEVTAARTMIERAREHHDLWPARLAADTAYGSAEMLDWLVHDQGIEPHIPVIDKSERIDGTFSRADFAYDHAADLYRCPGGKELKQHRRPFRADHPDTPPDNTYRYRASKMDCDACALKSRCCPKAPARKVTRSIHEGARDFARDIARTDAYVVSRRERKKVEMLFAHLKRILKLDRLRLRGPNGAKDEFLLAATAQNLRKLAKLIPPLTPATA
jgi:hypothetical protein